MALAPATLDNSTTAQILHVKVIKLIINILLNYSPSLLLFLRDVFWTSDQLLELSLK